MCAVSMVVDAFRQQYPDPKYIPYRDVTDMSEIIKKLDALDKKIIPHKPCVDDRKEEYLKKLEARIEELERKANG